MAGDKDKMTNDKSPMMNEGRTTDDGSGIRRSAFSGRHSLFPRHSMATGALLTVGGLLILAAAHALSLLDATPSIAAMTHSGGQITGYVAIVLGMLLLAHSGAPVEARPRSGRRPHAGPYGGRTHGPDGAPAKDDAWTAARITGAFQEWMRGRGGAWAATGGGAWESGTDGRIWNGLDQFLREMLVEHLGAQRVRCLAYRPSAGEPDDGGEGTAATGGEWSTDVSPANLPQSSPLAEGLIGLSALDESGLHADPASAGSCSSKGPASGRGAISDGDRELFERVIQTGAPWYAPPADAGAAAADDGERRVMGAPCATSAGLGPSCSSAASWSAVWPVFGTRSLTGAVVQERLLGVIAIGGFDAEQAPTRRLVEAVLELLTLCWAHVRAMVELRIAERTDQATGVLTRADFFRRGAEALEASYADGEPAALIALSLEGMRGLDDAGRWTQRDRLLEELGQALLRRLRAEDVVGRFSDDRFVIVLRRLDTGLARLVGRKLLSAARECLATRMTPAAAGGRSHVVRVRLGVAGGGQEHTSLRSLLVEVFESVGRERLREESQTSGAENEDG